MDQINTLHSFMIVRHGKVIAEGWWAPEAADKPHVLWSLSKSFNSTAVGLAIAEGKLSLEDPVLKFFPDEAPANPSDNLKAMKVGDRAFFYHSNEGLAVVGIAEITKPAYPDPSDKTGKFVMVDLKPVAPMKTPVALTAIKAEPKLKDIALVKNSRLSVQPVDAAAWKLICKMGGVKPE